MITALSALIAAAVGIALVVLVPGVTGIVSGIAVATLLYLGLPLVLKPQARLGGVVASALPDGEAAAARVEEANRLLDQVDSLATEVRNADVRREVAELGQDVRALVSYVERRPRTYRRLAHFLSTYGEQCLSMLRGYRSVEAAATGEELARAESDALRALNDLQGVAQGELRRAMGTETTELSADSEAIRRLMEMDGYGPDEAGADEGNGK